MPEPVEAWFFDGRSSQPLAVFLSLESGCLCLRTRLSGGGEGALLMPPIPVSRVAIDEPLGPTRKISIVPALPEDVPAYCEARQGAAMAALLSAMGHREGLAVRWQGSLAKALAACAGLVLLLFAAYFWGLPPLADRLARWVPEGASHALDAAVIDSLEKADLLKPSRLSRQEQARIRTGFEKLVWPAGTMDRPGIELHFYAAPRIGANAFALPGGKVVVTDEIVKLAGDTPPLLAVLGHEAGHVVHRHGLRQLAQASVIGVAVGLWLGDFSSATNGLSTLVLQNRYSREYELAADDYSIETLRRSGLSPGLLAGMLEKLAAAHGGPPAGRGGEADALERILSTHPPTAERIRRIREG